MIREAAGVDAAGASGVKDGCLDFIPWDLKAVLDSAMTVFGPSPVAWVTFQTCRTNVDGLSLKNDAEQSLYAIAFKIAFR